MTDWLGLLLVVAVIAANIGDRDAVLRRDARVSRSRIAQSVPHGQRRGFRAEGVTGLTHSGYRVNMPTSVELRRMRRIHRWMGIILPGVVRRVVNGRAPQPGWLPRRWMTVVSSDVDLDAGIGAVWLVWRPRAAKAETHTALMELCGEEWHYTGGGSSSDGDLPVKRSAAGQPGQVGMIELGGGAGALRRANRLRHPYPHSIGTAPWIGSNQLQVAAEVDHLLVGRMTDRGARGQQPHRRLEVPVHRPRGTRPLIVAMGRDGSELSRIGPHDGMDSYTWAKLSGQ